MNDGSPLSSTDIDGQSEAASSALARPVAVVGLNVVGQLRARAASRDLAPELIKFRYSAQSLQFRTDKEPPVQNDSRHATSVGDVCQRVCLE